VSDLDFHLNRIGVLAEPVRRALYQFVVGQREPVTRDQAVAAVGVARHVVKFNLDRLVEEGLLEADYRRPSGRGGPGAGRPAKTYRRADLEVEVSLPARRYDLAARLLLQAVANTERAHRDVAGELERVAVDTGRELGIAAAKQRGRWAGKEDAVIDTLAGFGYEPRHDSDGITLVNCPFHALVRDETEIVCGMNRCFLDGLLDGLGAERYDAELDPAPGRCCVRIRAS
jgi:predicted ArsR family transcriptional regulator